jgi:hypothetical protein
MNIRFVLVTELFSLNITTVRSDAIGRMVRKRARNFAVGRSVSQKWED